VSPIKSWKEAEQHLLGLKWEKFRNAIGNRWNQLLDEHFRREGYRQYADHEELVSHLDTVTKSVKKVVEKKLKGIDRHLSRKYESVAGSFIYHVIWDCNFAGYEFVCQDLVKPLFQLEVLFPWYQRGHLPCGWDGKLIRGNVWDGDSSKDLPSGKLRVNRR
jgi:hypothetical protein